MAVAAAECRGPTAGDPVELRGDRPASPAVLVEAPAEHPRARREATRVGLDPSERRIDRRIVSEVDLIHLDRPPGEVHVAVVPAGGHEPAAKIDPLGVGVRASQVRGRTDRGDPPVSGDQRFGTDPPGDVDASAVEEGGAHGRMMPAVSAGRAATRRSRSARR